MYQRIALELLEPNKGQIKGLPKNPRKWSDEDLQDLAASLKETPELYEARPLLVIPFKKKFVVLGGNMRQAASVLNGDPDAPCWVYDENTPVEKLKEIVLKDNSSFGAWDTEAFAKDWSWTAGKKWGIPDFGFDNSESSGSSGSVGSASSSKEDGFDENKETVPARVKPGDIWRLGRHTVVCCDSTDAVAFSGAIAGRFDLCFTSPPYNIMSAFNTNKTTANRYMKECGVYEQGDDDLSDEEYKEFLSKALKNALSVCDDVLFNIGTVRGALRGTAMFLGENSSLFGGIVAWVKSQAFIPQFPDQYGVLKNLFEPIYLFNAEGRRKFHHPQWEKNVGQDNIIRTASAAGNEYADEHKATFPVSLPGEVICAFSEKGGSVLDLFGGTGTTLIAAEQDDRICSVVEINSHYCDIILARWEKLTGGKAELVRNIKQ